MLKVERRSSSHQTPEAFDGFKDAGCTHRNIARLQQHARGVLHALDPDLVSRGPGLGYGVRRAVVAIAQHVEAVAAEGGRDVAIAAPRAAAAAQQVLAWAEALATVAQQMVSARRAVDAAALVPELQRLARQLTHGADLDGDERITFAPGEAGLLGLRLTLGSLKTHRDGLATLGMEVPR